MASPKCVQCKSENVQKVSAVYHAGVSTSHTHGHKYGYRKDKKGRWVPEVQPYSSQTTHKTRLAELLSPPSKPGSLVGLTTVCVIAVLSLGAFLTYGLLVRVLGESLAPLGCLLLFALLLFSLVPEVWGREKRHYARYKEAVQEWEKSCRKWDELYYCAACDSVFDRSTGKSASVHSLKTLL